MIKILKVLVLFTVLVFTGCDEPLGEKKTKHIVEKSKMDPRLQAYPEAVEWYEDSEIYPEAAFSLGYFYKNTLKDYHKSIEWYKKAYEMGYLKAANNMAIVYEDLKDYKKAIDWYTIASNKNIDKAPNNLGYLYKNTYKNYKLALQWYKVGIEREFTINKRYIMVISSGLKR